LLKALSIISAALALTVFSGCAGHKDLTAPCAEHDSTVEIPLFSAIAFASDISCGPMVRQNGVSVF
jgi:hypothetical protein